MRVNAELRQSVEEFSDAEIYCKCGQEPIIKKTESLLP